MKTLEELGISPAPWVQCNTCDDIILTSDLSLCVATTDGSGTDSVNSARLIAAAPDLYEVLREMCEQVEGGDVHFTGASAWLAKARAALEKAGGKE